MSLESADVAPSTSPSKTNPELLALRAPPRRPVRFRRNLLVGLAAAVSASVAAIAWVALQPAGLRLAARGDELYSPERKAPPDEIEQLPSSYSELPPDVPRLGPPLPGDLGRPILRHEREMAREETSPPGEAAGPTDEAAAEERQRMAEEAQQVRASPVMMQLTAVTRSPAEPAAPGVPGIAAPAAPAGQAVAFMAEPSSGVINPHRLQLPASPWLVSAGSVIAASLLTGLNSDLPGMVVAQVTEPVYDTPTGRTLLIPQGARLVGRYDSAISFGQSRALVVWNRLVFPDGSSLELDALPAADPSGYAGLEDRVDFHTWQLLRGIGLSTLLGVGTELSLGDSESDLVRAVRESAQSNSDRAGQRIVERNLDIEPTITIRPGFPLRVMVHKDLILRPWR